MSALRLLGECLYESGRPELGELAYMSAVLIDVGFRGAAANPGSTSGALALRLREFRASIPDDPKRLLTDAEMAEVRKQYGLRSGGYWLDVERAPGSGAT